VLYREGKVIICVTTKLETFPLLYHLCKLLTLLEFYFISKLNNLTSYYLNCVTDIYITI